MKCITFSFRKFNGFGNLIFIAKVYIFGKLLDGNISFICSNVDSFYSVNKSRDVNRNV